MLQTDKNFIEIMSKFHDGIHKKDIFKIYTRDP